MAIPGIDFFSMNCRMHASIDSDAPQALQCLARVPLWFAEWEQCLSRFNAESELSRLNQSNGTWVPVGDVLWAVLQASLNGAVLSDGLVLPTVLPAMHAAGYDRSFEQLLRRASSG